MTGGRLLVSEGPPAVLAEGGNHSALQGGRGLSQRVYKPVQASLLGNHV